MPVLIFAYIPPQDPVSAVLLLTIAPAIPILIVLVGSHAEKRMQDQWAALSRMSAHFLDVLQGLPTLKDFGRSAAKRERVARIGEDSREKTLAVLRYAFLSGLVLDFVATLSIALVAVGARGAAPDREHPLRASLPGVAPRPRILPPASRAWDPPPRRHGGQGRR